MRGRPPSERCSGEANRPGARPTNARAALRPDARLGGAAGSGGPRGAPPHLAQLARGGGGRGGRVSSALAMGVDYRSRSGDQPGREVRSEGGPQCLGAAALGPDTGQEEGCARHELSQPCKVLGPGGAANGPHVGQAALGRLPHFVHEPGQALVHRRVTGVLEVGGARVRGTHEDEDSSTCGPGGLHQGLEAVTAHQGVRGEGIGTEARHGAERTGSLAHQRLAVGLRGDRDVAALAVGDHQQAVFAGRRGRPPQRSPAGGSEALEAGQLDLDRHARRPCRLDRQPAVAPHRRGSPDGRLAVRVVALERLRPQRGRIRIEPEHDLTAPLLDEGGEPVGEVGQRALGAASPSRSSSRQSRR